MNLKEFSKKIGLSSTTISRALGGYPEVSAKTRERVREAAKKYHYQPNVRAQSLATGRTKMVGFVITKQPGYEFFSPVFGDFIAGAATYYSNKGYDTVISLVDERNILDALRNLKASGKVDGLIVQAPKRFDQRIGFLSELGIPFVVHGRTDFSEPYTYVDVDNRRAFEKATKLLIDFGHRRIALLNGNEEMDFAWRRRMGFEDAHKNLNLTVDPSLMFSSEMTEQYGYQCAKKLLSLDNAPTAAVVSSLLVAEGVRRALYESGLEIGRDFSVVTHDDDLSYLPNGSENPIFTATRSNVREAGQLCAEYLVKQIENYDGFTRQTVLEADLIIGNSTGPAPKL